MSTQHQEALRGSVVNSSRSSLHCRSVTRALLSIRPQYAAAILRGEKRYEFRRTVFSRHVDVVLVYVPSPVRRVVAEFDVDGVITESLPQLWQRTRGFGGIDEAFFYRCFHGVEYGHAIAICLLYTSDAADDLLCVDLGGRRI